ncbi:MAG: entericidin A/B family lipoprotein [Methylococcaceae bacterium]
MNKKIIAVIVIGFAILLTGCNTLSGMGRDVEKVGEAIQKTTR